MDFNRPVDNSVIVDCIRLATFAPNGGNYQDWRWIVITDSQLRNRLAAIVTAPGERAGTSTERQLDPAIRRSATYLLEHMAEVPVFVLACVQGRLPGGASNQALSGFYGSILPAVWSLQIALRARGLGSVLTTTFLKHEKEVADLLDIPADVTQVALIPVAYITGNLASPPRRPVEEVVYWDHWGPPSSTVDRGDAIV